MTEAAVPQPRYVPKLVSYWDQKKQAMVDNETLSTSNRSAVFSISAAFFKLVGTETDARPILSLGGANRANLVGFNYYIDPLYYMKRSTPYDVSDETVQFTMEKNRTEWRRAVEFGVSPKEAITAFRDWFRSQVDEVIDGKTVTRKYRLWANSPDFDLAQLRYMAEVEGVDLGLDFRSNQDMRTIRESADLLGIQLPVLRNIEGYESHTGVADVFGQIIHVNAFYNAFYEPPKPEVAQTA